MNTGIRSGMLELLSDAGFRSRVEEIVRNQGPDSFSKALRDYTPAGKAKDVLAPANDTLGYRVETAFRGRLDRIPAFGNRGAVYETFLDLLNRSRTYILHVGSVSKRSLKGSRIDNSRAALARLIQVSQGYGIPVILFQAPTNPDVPLYATTEDDRDYHGFVNSIATQYGLKIFDFEHTIPGPNWGKVMNLPDPLHLSRTGHQIMAREMIARLDQSGM
jgi:hypothetical protein